MRRTAARVAAVLVLTVATAARAGIPCLVDAAGTPLRWQSFPIVYRMPPGSGTSQGAPLVAAGAQVWNDVPTAQVSFAAGELLPDPIDENNYLDFVGRCGDGVSPIIVDPTGDIIEDAVGEGGSEFVLGFAIHDCDLESAPAIPEASVVINGRFFGLSSQTAQANVTAVIAHELGHVLNLCHVRLHDAFVDDGNAENDAFVPLMFPFASGDSTFPDPRPRFDDRSMLALLYPAPGVHAATATVAGHVVTGVGAAPVSGAPVIVRNVADPLGTAAWTSSGWVKIEGSFDAPVLIDDPLPATDGGWQASLLPPGEYTVEVQGGPMGPGEFFSGPGESSDPSADPPDLASVLALGAGTVRTDVSVFLPIRVRSVFGETDWDVTWRGRLVAQGRTQRLPDIVPAGTLTLLSTGSYAVAPATYLGGTWRARGKRGASPRPVPEAVESAIALGDSAIDVRSTRGKARVDRSLRVIRGSLSVRGRTLSPPRVPFTLTFAFRGSRAREGRTLGHLPLVPVP